MLTFLRGLFKREKSVMLIPLDELELWFQNHIHERVADLDGVTQQFYDTLRRLLLQLRAQRDALLQASFDDRVEPRVKSIVFGHRENYCRELGIFLNHLSVPNTSDVIYTTSFCEELTQQLDEFAQHSAKSYAAARHLFHEPLDSIAATLRDISSSTSSFAELLRGRGIYALDEIGVGIHGLLKERDHRSRLHEELHVKKTRLEQAQKQLAEKKKDITVLRESVDFQNYQNFVEKQAVVEREMGSTEREITHTFLELERYFRKYIHHMPDSSPLITHYMAHAVEALVADEHFRLGEILMRLSESFLSLGLGEEETAKLRTLLPGLPQKLCQLRKQLLLQRSELDHIRHSIAQNSLVRRLEEEEYKLTHFNQQEERFTRDIADIQQTIDGIHLDNLQRSLEATIGKSLEISLRII